MSTTSESDFESQSELISKFQKLLQVEEYFGQYSSDEEDEPPRNRINIKTEQMEDIGPSEIRESEEIGHTDEEIDHEMKYEPSDDPGDNPWAEAFIGVSDEGYDANFPIGIRENVFPRRSRRRRPRLPTIPRGYRQEYEPKGNPRTEEDDILDLDCALHKEKEIDGWGRKMQVTISSNAEKFQSLEAIDSFLEFKTRGNVAAWWNTTAVAFREQIRKEAETRTNPQIAYIQLIQRLLYNEFIGVRRLDNRAATEEAEANKARSFL